MKEGETASENWTIYEVLKASIILTTYHGLCSFCLGMGIPPDLDIAKEM